MGCVRPLFITLSWIAFVFAEANIAEVTILKYDGLKSNYFRSRAQLKQFYHFQFCLCPHDANPQSQSPFHNKCECTPLTRGKRVADSYPHAVFSSSCIFKTSSTSCLKATFARNSGPISSNERLLIRVTIEKTTISQPEWQELPIYNLKGTYPIRTAAGPSLR
ncbi:hypothetical protein OESDEN_03713 [Oesophagostomum dentatum]|uniref:Phlebovirus glycoprotein G2 fusion domain-containing protein n=1 Tax=Oesophagostomum dentatum TaxID=61180 RepID=A0A0B1TGE1_OESDE|nr:hypothetical protein OESDEN_03713 [Oesophagostomum dentatum]